VFGRTPKLPADLTPKLDRDERVITWAKAEGAAIVVTNRGLWLPNVEARTGWHEIHKAAWADGVLTVTGAEFTTDDAHAGYAMATDATPTRIPIAVPGAVPRRVRERVNASVAFTSLYPVPGGGAARVVARRVSGQDGLTWSVRLEGPATKNASHPDVQAAVDQLVSDAKASIAVVD
jgi:hypothetical protein